MHSIQSISNPLILNELKTFPLQAVIWGIIDRNNQGELFELCDKSILILESQSSEPFVFIAGPLSLEGIEETIAYVSRFDYPMIYCQPKYHAFFLNKQFDFLLRVEMQLETPPVYTLIQNDCTIEPILTFGVLQKCQGFKDTLNRYGSFGQFIKYGKGYVLRKDDKIISEAYADYIGGGYLEIGVITHPKYRSLGFGTKIVTYLTKECLSQQITPVYGTHISNRNSISLGLKTGFSISKYYVLMVPNVGNTLGKPLLGWIKDNPEWDIEY